MGQLNVVPHRLKFDAAKVEVVVAPTALHLGTVQGAITNPNVNVATQNLSLTGNGAFTGELSGAMVQDAGIKYTLTGHSERRALYVKSDEDVSKKNKVALDHGMTVLVSL